MSTETTLSPAVALIRLGDLLAKGAVVGIWLAAIIILYPLGAVGPLPLGVHLGYLAVMWMWISLITERELEQL